MEQQSSFSKGIWSTEKINKCIDQYNKTGILPNPNPFYNSDIRYRKPRLNYEYTKEEIKEMAKCEDDILYYAENYAKVTTDEGIRNIKLRKYQSRILQQFVYYKNNILLASRQCGKSFLGNYINSDFYNNKCKIDFLKLYKDFEYHDAKLVSLKIFIDRLLIKIFKKNKFQIFQIFQIFFELFHKLITYLLYRDEIKTIKNNDETILSFYFDRILVTDNNSLEKIHICQPSYHYLITFSDNSSIIISKDHPLIDDNGNEWRLEDHLICDHNTSKNYFSFFKRTSESNYKKYFKKRDSDGNEKLVEIKKITRSFFKLYGYSVSVNGTHTYYFDDFNMHNCVTAETKIEIYDKEKDTKYQIPIYELYYKNLKKPKFLDKIEYFLQKIITKLKNKVNE